VGPDHDPESCAFIDTAHPGFPFPGKTVTTAVGTNSLDYPYGTIPLDEIGAIDRGTPVYCGTLIMDASPHACGTFTVGFIADETYITGPEFPSPQVFPQTVALTVTVSPCVPILLSCDPGHCSIDARIPHHPQDPTARFNTRTVLMQFASPTLGMTPSDFDIVLVPAKGVLPGIASVATEGNTATVTLNRRIPAGHWTCIEHQASRRQCCLGSLPGDANLDLRSEPLDLLALRDHLPGQIPAGLRAEQCDTDRSGICAPADLLMAVDLLTGADAFEPYLGRELPECPEKMP
jgi:hypothetical protein